MTVSAHVDLLAHVWDEGYTSGWEDSGDSQVTTSNLPETPNPYRESQHTGDLWDRAAAVAAERGETLSDVIRAALEHYVEEA